MDLMAAAGYDPRASLDLWFLLNEIGLEGAQNGPLLQKAPFLRTHPTGDQRFKVGSSLRHRSCIRADRRCSVPKKLEKHMPKALEIFEKATKTQEKAKREHPVVVPDGGKIRDAQKK
jgi:hypothetical protein